MCSTERDARESGLVTKVTRLLSAFTATDRRLSGAELARRTGLARSTVHRIAGELVTEGLFERTPTGQYQLGMRLFELGQLAPRQRGLRESAAPYLTDLRDATRETVHLAVLDGTDVVYLDILQSLSAPPLKSRVGGRMPAVVTGVGKAILAFAGKDVFEQVVEAGLPRMTRYSITNPTRLATELAQIRLTGSAFDHQEQALGTTCCASPIFSAANKVVAAVSVAGHTSTLRVERVAAAVRSTALAISRTQGSTRKMVVQPERV